MSSGDSTAPRAVIGGKLYDVNTATLIHDWDNGYPLSDFQHCHEALYRTPHGRFFLVGSGGPMTRYARTVAGGVTGSKDIITPLTVAEALTWCERHGADVDDILHHFDGVEDA